VKIYIDYDSTLINFIGPWLSWVNNKYKVTLQSNDINRWYFLGEVFGKEADYFWRSKQYNHYADKTFLQPYQGAKDFFQTMQKQFEEKNVIIISSTKEHHKIEKLEHAQYYFGVKQEQFIPINGSQEKYTFTKDGILIDDYSLDIMKHVSHNQQKGFVFNYDNKYGWCKKNNFVLDKYLSKFMHVVDDRNFHIATSYN